MTPTPPTQPGAATWPPTPEKRYDDGRPCAHPGCLSHVSHPCEGCGRIAGRYPQPGAETRGEPFARPVRVEWTTQGGGEILQADGECIPFALTHEQASWLAAAINAYAPVPSPSREPVGAIGVGTPRGEPSGVHCEAYVRCDDGGGHCEADAVGFAEYEGQWGAVCAHHAQGARAAGHQVHEIVPARATPPGEAEREADSGYFSFAAAMAGGSPTTLRPTVEVRAQKEISAMMDFVEEHSAHGIEATMGHDPRMAKLYCQQCIRALHVHL